MILVIESNNEQVIRLIAELAAAFQARVQIEGLDEVPAEVRSHRTALGSRFKGGLRTAAMYQPDPAEWYEQ
ncbi:MAG: hypothetical protein NW241_15695 [Bacteroidia bacterium]|nr:hypothetical protein [Bacteroidia bacterium]